MTDLKLDFDEEIILQSTEVERYGIKETSLDEMVLTNKHIICVYNKSTGLFSKPEIVVEKIPLSTIKVVDGRVQVMSYDNDNYGLGLQVLFISGHREHFLFYDEKKELSRWEKAVVKVITEKNTGTQASNVAMPPIDNEMAENKTDKIGDVLTGVSTGLFSAFKGAVDTVKQTISEMTSDTAEENNAGHSTHLAEDAVEVNREQKTLTEVNTAEPEEMTKETKKYIYCTNCGEKITAESKFCNNCGTPTGNTQEQKDEDVQPPPMSAQDDEPEQEQKDEPITERQTVYEGKLYKCPNCGEVLKSFVTNCPVCGHEIRGVKTSSPVETLAKKVEQASSLDERIELIANFYIPNTKEDIYDFFILAVSNLEDKWYDTDDAWRAKLEQAYHKARLSFGKTEEFEYLEKLYLKTRKEVDKRERGIAATFRRNKVACITGLMVGGGIIMMLVGIIIFATVSAEENWGGSYGGFMLLVIGLNLLIAPTWALEELKKKENPNYKRKGAKTKNSNVQTVGKDSGDFLNENYADMVEFLKARGFNNIEIRAERKGLLDTEGAIKGISVAGNTEFDEYDEFNINTKIIIRYYSRKH